MSYEDAPSPSEFQSEERERQEEEWYRSWCRIHILDPDDQATARLYEETVDADAQWEAYNDAREEHR